jgi:drug/metabolite transporter (DMT)-like permease
MNKMLRSNLLLLLTAFIWGFAFVAQRVGMEHVEPFTFNGIRFALGSLSLLPLLIYHNNHPGQTTAGDQTPTSSWRSGLLAGIILFVAASLQQIGLIYTTAGKAAFITALYIVLVPLIGIFLKQSLTITAWLGSGLAIIGLYFLCVKEGFTIATGDLFELIGALFWTAHILVIDRFSRTTNTLQLAFYQFITCSLLSLSTAAWLESVTLNELLQASIPILYGGIGSVGIAYTLQIIGQKNASPAHASIILSMETVFAALGGYLILGEQLGLPELFGCTLMLSGMLLSQLNDLKPKQKSLVSQSNDLG